MNAVIEHNTTGVVEKQTAPITPMEMLDRAVSSGASVETLEPAYEPARAVGSQSGAQGF
jgi:hypothetical protein